MPALTSQKGCKVKQSKDGRRKCEVEYVIVTSLCLCDAYQRECNLVLFTTFNK